MVEASQLNSNINGIRYSLPPVRQHADCRRLEVAQAARELEFKRFVWISADYDMGGDDFLAHVLQVLDLAQSQIYLLEMQAVYGVGDFYERCSGWVGGVHELLIGLAKISAPILILDDIPLLRVEADEHGYNDWLVELVGVLLDACPNLKVVLRSPFVKETQKVKQIILNPLDEAETRTYISLHQNGKHASQEQIGSGEIFRYTNGIPGRIDRVLKLLETGDFSSIVNGRSEQFIDDLATLPERLVKEIEQLKAREESSSGTYRSFSLLMALAVFPFGENVETITYFDGFKAYRSAMAGDLIAAGLCDSVVSEESELGDKGAKTFIVVKKNVQAYLIKLLGEEALPVLYEKAVGVYFGRDWRVRDFKLASVFDLQKHRLSPVVEQNASFILNKFISDVLGSRTAVLKDKLDRIRVLHYYVERLRKHGKYLYINQLCKVVWNKLAPYSDEAPVKNILFMYSRSFRMLGMYEECIEHFNKFIKIKSNTARVIASAHINLAYCHKALGDNEQALLSANLALKFQPKGDSAYHAESIKIQLKGDSERKYSRLRKLEVKARRDSCFVAANNINLECIAILKDREAQRGLYKKAIAQCSSTGDEYNLIRSIVYYSKWTIDDGLPLDQKEYRSLFHAYIYTCGQRLMGLFNMSHNALWSCHEDIDSLDMLFWQFKYSSILQRLTGRDADEEACLRRLVSLTKGQGVDYKIHNEFDVRYFMSRALSYNILSSENSSNFLGW
ncbi:tetratricopeptide repeat protein [Pseudomonas multiresinivorans]|uniref:Tetratricopeptide repeat-containing protein n=1 Tax=Pseudomonas multiresinivorans TaxID=95301 RepID=A0A7Z3GPA5_9PSED|nr:hypothetical protein [Pseudomonas multiresinivorans]QJP07773.1 hypothetical protein G4G71_07750 [Pseudomonas multiresinivorans]